MYCIIKWCNVNEGFMTAILSLVGLLLSGIAIGVSIHTARLPFKRGLKLSCSYDFVFTKNKKSEIERNLGGMRINAVNTGFRDINIVFLGIAVKKHFFSNSFREFAKLDNNNVGAGILSPTSIATIVYDPISLALAMDELRKREQLYIFARDSEGNRYHQRIGKVYTIEKDLRSNWNPIIVSN